MLQAAKQKQTLTHEKRTSHEMNSRGLGFAFLLAGLAVLLTLLVARWKQQPAEEI